MDPSEAISEALANITRKLTPHSVAQSKYSIYRVHKHLRNVNDKAYEPEIISIGPYHYKKESLRMMEDLKLQYMNSLVEENEEIKERLVSVVGELEQDLRKCYAEPIDLSATEFIEMMVLDGCFIVQLVRKFNMNHLRHKNDPIFQMDWMLSSLQRDLMLFENQLPLIVVRKLFELIEVQNDSRLVFLILRFFRGLYPGAQGRSNTSLDDVKHLLELIHINWIPSSVCVNISEDGQYERKRGQFIQSSTKLAEANVKFEKRESGTLFNIEFKRGTMFLPPLTIEDRTESFFRNLIVYEQYFQDVPQSFVTDYVKFFDCLIDSSRDVEILHRYKIIDSWLGDDEAIAKMFNKLADSVVGPGKCFIYAEIFDRVNVHCSRRCNRWAAKFRHNYLNGPWAVISLIAAIVLLLLTVTQTVFTMLRFCDYKDGSRSCGKWFCESEMKSIALWKFYHLGLQLKEKELQQ